LGTVVKEPSAIGMPWTGSRRSSRVTAARTLSESCMSAQRPQDVVVVAAVVAAAVVAVAPEQLVTAPVEELALALAELQELQELQDEVLGEQQQQLGAAPEPQVIQPPRAQDAPVADVGPLHTHSPALAGKGSVDPRA